MNKTFFKKLLPNIIIDITRPLRYLPQYLIGNYYILFRQPVKIFNSKYFFPKNTRSIELGGYFFGNYEKEEKYLIDKYIEIEDTVIELGGNVGVISNQINRKLKNKQKHLVFEPNPNLIYYLEINKKINKSNFEIIEGVISKNEKIEFFISNNILSSSTKIKSNNLIYPKCFNLNELIEKYKTKFNTLVMDIEGGEIDLIKNFNLFNFSKLIIEFHPGKTSIEEINSSKKILKDYGFKMIDKKSDVEFWFKK